ncbi:putative lipoprotein with Yx(FWY)xxD motif [Streptomyces avidinii]|uniref:Lipoprotein with Yx(FWY)xxD motif n=2 Tax=Streptomyces avidinii TaxID=1895 RepID=A0ABS4LA37_STRAV|nr:SCO0930 family lipoprotein [Streptomyces avidinii]MBP2038977.1 putative lipoprotein with Yx(FWY)xxD motif [Streptomyces avidinii]
MGEIKMGIKRGTTLATAAIVVVLAATACGPTDDKAADTTKPVGAAAAQDYGQAPAAADGAAGAAGAAGAKPAGQLTAAPNDQLGQVLTDSAGLTLYRFDKDTAKPPKSNCDGDCAKTWPVVAAGDATAAAGMDPALLGEVVRTDGSKQLTVAGWPAYRYNKDAKAGDVNGQGVGGVWFAFGPDGKKAAKAEAAAPAPAEGGAAEADGKLSVAKDPKLGDHIVDGKGMTVYRFKPDTQWPMTSKCVGDCLTKWPVVAPVEKAKDKGIVEKNYTVLNRPDGQKQQSVDCWPVYTFSGDKKPGDINGQGVGGTWYAVSPDGKLITVQ